MNGIGKKYSYLKYLLYIAPSFIIWFIFGLFPNLQIFQLSLFNWDGISPIKRYVGFQNYSRLTLDPTFFSAIVNTVVYMIVVCTLQTGLGLLYALILKKNTLFNKSNRTLFFSPLVLGTVMVVMIWSYIYDANLGILNTVLDYIGLDALKQNWLGVPILAVFCIAFVHAWHYVGYSMTITLAGLQTIPDTLYQAAQVEGANTYQIFKKITMPLLIPTISRLLLLTISGAAVAFDYVYSLGGSQYATKMDTLSVFMYRSVLTNNIGKPSSVGVILVIFVFIVYLLQFSITKKFEDSYL